MKLKDLKVIPDYQETPIGSYISFETIHGRMHGTIYLHGNLEARAGFDICYHQEKLGEVAVELEDESGEQNVDVLVDNDLGKEHIEAILVWWITDEGHQRVKGLICAKGDQEALEYARECSGTRTPTL